ncbi:MAG: TldD/PmbA family protein [Clostridia bacterium]|nr:TldD/PmbA family protein [Clostridia bacterium]
MNRQQFIDKLFAGAKKAGIEECEAYFTSGESFDVDILEGAIREYSVSDRSGMCFRGVYAGKMGYASTEIEDEEAIEMLIEGVKNNALLLGTQEHESIFAGSESYPQVDCWDEDVTKLPAAEKIALATEMEKRVKALSDKVARVDGCGISTSTGEVRIVNSKGLDISRRSTLYGAMVAPIVMDGEKPNFGYDYKYSHSVKDVDTEQVAQKAVDKALEGLGAVAIPSGSYKCIFRNDMASTLLGTFAGVFSAESARKGMSLLKGKEGEKIASDAVTITDDPLLKGGLASCPFDAEGVAHTTNDIVKDGVFLTLLHNRLTAQEMGKTTTGNAAKAGYAGKVTVAPTNFFIQPGKKTPEQLIEEVGEGILITSLMGMHSGANPISGDFSLGAKGFMIKDGKKAFPVEQITVAGNFFEILKNIRAVACDLEFAHPGMSCVGSPALYVGEISVAGK